MKVDRALASNLGVKMQAIDTTLSNAFSQRQISTIYTARNQYRVILEIDPEFQRDPGNLSRLCTGAGRAWPFLSRRSQNSLAAKRRSAVNHQGQYPAVTISFALRPDTTLSQATDLIRQAVAEMHLPDTIRADFAGDARAFTDSGGSQSLCLIIAAIVAVYIVLGVLYESLAHPLTIISTLPSAGLGGACLLLQIFKAELSIIAFIGIILLIGIVKKNGDHDGRFRTGGGAQPRAVG